METYSALAPEVTLIGICRFCAHRIKEKGKRSREGDSEQAFVIGYWSLVIGYVSLVIGYLVLGFSR